MQIGLIGGGIIFALFLLGHLAYYEPQEGEFPYSSRAPRTTGMLLAHVLYKWFGIFAYLIPAEMLLSTYLFSKRVHLTWHGMAWLLWQIIVVGWSCTLAAYLEVSPLVSERMPSYGGITGIFFCQLLPYHLGLIGTKVVLLLSGIAILAYGFTLWMELAFLITLEKLETNKATMQKTPAS